MDTKQLHLISDRDLDRLRHRFSHDIVNGNPRHRLLCENPLRPWDFQQKVYFPEPIRPRCEWSKLLWAQAVDQGLLRNEAHEDCTFRDFDAVLQETVHRDALLLDSPETFGTDRPLDVCIGFDGFDDLVHVMMKLINYKPSVAKESEIKARVLALARGNDHSENLCQVLSCGLRSSIESYIRETKCVTLNGRLIPVRIATCLDYVASRAMAIRRSNAPVHSHDLAFASIIEAPAASTWPQIEAVLQRKAPWAVWDPEKPLNHIPTHYPWRCPVTCCDYHVESKEEQEDNEVILGTLRKCKAAKAKASLAKRTAAHCDAHRQYMEFQTPALCVHPRDNIADFLHGMDINLPEKMFCFSFHDPTIMAATPDLKGLLTTFYTAIGCPLDMIQDVGGRRRWFHGSVWRYDFVMGANRKSFGLDVNILILCLIVFGVKEEDQAPQQRTTATSSIVNQ